MSIEVKEASVPLVLSSMPSFWALMVTVSARLGETEGTELETFTLRVCAW